MAPSAEASPEQVIPPATTVWLPPVPNTLPYATAGETMVVTDAHAAPPWCAWLAVAVTSVMFALVHPLWTAPIIFFLAMILGYVYERTGNLWAVILLHATFNSINTAFYLAGAAN